jgi:L-histidine Nalpha-methyltransferase
MINPIAVLEAAYNDSEGITAAFNRNILSVVNKLAEANFEPTQWEHRAFFNAKHGRIEMHLEYLERQSVTWRGGHRLFERGERIHTENSYKFILPGFESLFESAGLRQQAVFTDDQQWFALVLAETD